MKKVIVYQGSLRIYFKRTNSQLALSRSRNESRKYLRRLLLDTVNLGQQKASAEQICKQDILI